MDIQSEQFEQLIAEALRAGPGSPPWHQAVEILREAGQQGEEYKLLCRAREDLASGRDYRTVRAGPGFTRKLMANIDRDHTPWSLPTANIVAIAAALFIIALIAVGAWFMFSPAKQSASLAQLADTYFLTTLKSEDFHSGMPADFEKIGLLPITFDNGAKVDVQTRAGDKHVGGGVRFASPLPPQKPFAVESAIEVADPKSELITQVFVTDKPDFDADTGLTPHELACIVDQGKVRVVLPDGKTAGDTDLLLDSQSACSLRIRFNADCAVVEHNGKAIWSGQHQLSPDRPRVIGARYLTRGGDRSTGITVKYLRVMEP